MTDRNDPPQTGEPTTRNVIEHALIDYGYSETTARALVDRVVEEKSR